MRPFIALLLVFLSFNFCGRAQQHTVESVPNPKVASNTFVSNPDNIISQEAVDHLNVTLQALEDSTTVQVAVVLLNSIGDENEVDFAQRLFEHWGIGQAGQDNGLLILLVIDQRKVRFHTGFGLEGILTDAVCKRIQMDEMVPAFTSGNYQEGILNGVRKVVDILSNPAFEVELSSIPFDRHDPDMEGFTLFLVIGWLVVHGIVYATKLKSGFADSPTIMSTRAPNTYLRKNTWIFFFIILPVLVIGALFLLGNKLIYFTGIYGYLWAGVVAKRVRLSRMTKKWIKEREYHRLYEFYGETRNYWVTMAVFFPLPFALLLPLHRRKQQSLRTIPRLCSQCNETTTKLDEVSDDSKLTITQVFEEHLGSIDYDVWLCRKCGTTQIEQYPEQNTEYKECPKCKVMAFYTESTVTLVEATTDSTGSRKITKLCKYCGNRNVQTETIARISDSSSGGSGSSGGSSDSGSFGGGDSGGGGSSSSW